MTNLAVTGGVPGPGRIGRVAIGDLLKRAAARFPDRTAVTDGERRVTYTEIERDANRLANYLVARGLKPGRALPQAPWRFPGAEVHQDLGRNADDGDREIAQGRTAPGFCRVFCGEGRVMLPSKPTTPRHSGARVSASPESITTTGSMDSGLAAEPVIGPRFCADPLAHPGTTIIVVARG
jgi:hypothetical protein